MNLKSLNSSLPHDLIKLIELIYSLDFKVSIVGGMVRDYLALGSISEDFDLELRPLKSTDNLIEEFESLLSQLKKSYKLDLLSYNVVRVELNELSCELSLPRIEKYNDSFHHSNFTASFVADLDYSQGYLRRDFSINAMYFEYDGDFKFIDPLNGQKDIKDKVLRPCSEDFYKDPVRFLRAIRFAIKLDFSIDDEIINKMKQLSLEDFSPHYLMLEAKKSKHPIIFFQKLLTLVTSREVKFKYQEYIDDYESLFTDLSISKFFKGALFLGNDFLTEVGSLLNIKLENIALDSYKFKDLVQSPYKFTEELVESAKKLKKIESYDNEIIDFYYKHKYFDLSSSDLQKLKETKVDISGVPNKEKSTYRFFHQLEILCES